MRSCAHLGHFVTESSEHFAEYVPWFIKHGTYSAKCSEDSVTK